MAGAALDFGDVIGMRIALDVSVATVALQHAVNAGRKGLAVHGDVVAGGIGHALVAVAGEAFSLCAEDTGCRDERECGECCGQGSFAEDKPRGPACGLGHSAVFFLRGEEALRFYPPGNSVAKPMASDADSFAEFLI